MTMANQRRDVETRERTAHWRDTVKKTGSSRYFLHIPQATARDFPCIYFISSTAWPVLLIARLLRVTWPERLAFLHWVGGRIEVYKNDFSRLGREGLVRWQADPTLYIDRWLSKRHRGMIHAVRELKALQSYPYDVWPSCSPLAVLPPGTLGT